MSNWLNRTTKNYLVGVSPRDMEKRFPGVFVDKSGNAQGNATWLLNPDMSAVSGQPPKYWVVSNDTVSLADRAARDSIDAAELSAARDTVADGLDDSESETTALGFALLDQINALRARDSLAAITRAQLKTAVRGKLGS